MRWKDEALDADGNSVVTGESLPQDARIVEENFQNRIYFRNSVDSEIRKESEESEQRRDPDYIPLDEDEMSELEGEKKKRK